MKQFKLNILVLYKYDWQGMMEFVENSDKALAALEKREGAKQQSNEVKRENSGDDVLLFHHFFQFSRFKLILSFKLTQPALTKDEHCGLAPSLV